MTCEQDPVVRDHWATYMWRPALGLSLATYVTSLAVLPFFHIQPAPIDPALVTVLGGVLGIASYFRGKMQADPSVPSDNRG